SCLGAGPSPTAEPQLVRQRRHRDTVIHDAMLLQSGEGDETLGPQCLLVAIDETGDEDLADPRYPVFGIGGCLTVVGEYQQQIRGPWSALKQSHFSGASAPLHAAGLRLTADQASALGNFFWTCTFGRFAAVTTLATAIDARLSRFEATALMMGNLLAKAAEAYRFTSMAVIFEHSERTEGLVRKTFSENKVYAGEAAQRWQVPTRFFFAKKHVAEPIVEVADFIMHASGTAVRSHRDSGVPLLKRRDFASVFEGREARRAAFLRLDALQGRQGSGGTA
ncbi:MAG: hypothetical protein ACRD5G_00480, partial [Candidatus Acidiferrales bacterium]